MPAFLAPGVQRTASSESRSPDSGFTLLFEQAAMSLVREMPVLAVSRQLEVTDKRLLRIVHHYVARMQAYLDLSQVANVGVDQGKRMKNPTPRECLQGTSHPAPPSSVVAEPHL